MKYVQLFATSSTFKIYYVRGVSTLDIVLCYEKKMENVCKIKDQVERATLEQHYP
jgi:hypothetical protein